MFKLLPILIVSVILAAFSDKRTKKLAFAGEIDKDTGLQKHIKKDKLFFGLMCIIMIAFLGTRTGYNDTYTYTMMYESTSANINDIFSISWSLSDVPGFNIVNILLRSFGTTTQNFIMFYAAFNTLVYIWFLRKYSTNFPLTIYFLFTMEMFVFMAAAIKQVTAISFALIAVDRLINKKYLSFFIFVTISCLFHPYAVIFYIVPFLTFKPWSKYTVLLIAFGIAIAFTLQNLFGIIDDMTTTLGGGHSESYYNSEGVSIFRFLVSAMPFLLSFFMCKERTREDSNRKESLLFNLAFLNCVLMFIALFGTGNQFGRFANYFLIFQTLTLPSFIEKIDDINSRKTVMIIVCVCYFAYFVYAYAISGNFDKDYWQMSLFDYLGTWF